MCSSDLSTYILYKNQNLNEYTIRIIKNEGIIKKNFYNSGDVIGIYKKDKKSEKTDSTIYVGECYKYSGNSFFDKFLISKNTEVKKVSYSSIIFERDDGIEVSCFIDDFLYKIYPLSTSSSKNLNNESNKTDFFDFLFINSSKKSYLDYWWALIIIAAVIFFIYTHTGNELKIKKIDKYIKQRFFKKSKYKEGKKDDFNDYLG